MWSICNKSISWMTKNTFYHVRSHALFCHPFNVLDKSSNERRRVIILARWRGWKNILANYSTDQFNIDVYRIIAFNFVSRTKERRWEGGADRPNQAHDSARCQFDLSQIHGCSSGERFRGGGGECLNIRGNCPIYTVLRKWVLNFSSFCIIVTDI